MVFFFDRVRFKKAHLLVFARKLVKLVRNDESQGKRLDPDFFIGIFLFGPEKFQNVRMKNVQINGARTLSLPQLI